MSCLVHRLRLFIGRAPADELARWTQPVAVDFTVVHRPLAVAAMKARPVRWLWLFMVRAFAKMLAVWTQPVAVESSGVHRPIAVVAPDHG